LDALSLQNIAFVQKQLDMPRIDVNPRNLSGTFLPRRLVDLGTSCVSPPRVVDSLDQDDIHKYATLSYCWGSPAEAKQQLKLNSESREQFYKEIPLEDMSPVMHDAVRVCRALKIRHIWIDALCILQGDKTDWEEQSSQMDMIFQHSYVSICTPASSSCMQGFLHRTSETCRPSIQICYVDETSNEVIGAYSLRPTLKSGQKTLFGVHPYVFPMLTAEQRDMSLSTWAHRGWIFQERFLSSMQIVFGDTMLHIRRDGVVMSENGEFKSQETVPFHGYEPPKFETINSILSRGQHLYDRWYHIIEQYAFMEWTERLDLFPGLSGIATLFQQAIHDRYLAGLWQKDLYCGLLWHTGKSTSRSPDSLGQLLAALNGDGLQIGPSWSWASRPDFFRFVISPRINRLCRVRSHLRPEFTLMSSIVSVDGVNPLGRLRKASLKLSGFMIRLRAGCLPISRNPDREWQYKTSKGHTLSIDPDWNFWTDESSNTEDVHIADDGKLQLLIISSCCSDWSSPNSESSTHHLPMEKAEDHTDWVTFKPHYRLSFYGNEEKACEAVPDCLLCSEHGRRRDVWGLLVYPTGIEMTFYRVGIFICRAEYGGSELFQEANTQVLELY
jgi:hypothetical protein